MATKVSDLTNEVYQAVMDWRRGQLLYMHVEPPAAGARSFYLLDEQGDTYRVTVKPLSEKSLVRPQAY